MNKINPIVFSALIFCGSANAITVKPMEVVGTPEDIATKPIKVYNENKLEEYVKVNLYRVENPGTAEEKEVPVDNSQALEFTAFPRQLRLASQNTSSIRLILPTEKPVESETLYRARVIPGLSFEKGVTLKVSYGVLIRVLPENPLTAISVQDNNNALTFRNTGNVRLHVKTTCEAIEKQEFRIYPNMTYQPHPACKRSQFDFEDDAGNRVNAM